MGFCSNSFVYTRTPFPQLNNCIRIHPSILRLVGQQPSHPFALPCSSSLFPFFHSPLPFCPSAEDSSPRSGFRAIKKRACCSRYSRRVRDRSCVISLPLPPRIESLQAGKRGIFISIFRRFLLLFSSLINFSLRSFLFLSFDKSSIEALLQWKLPFTQSPP